MFKLITPASEPDLKVMSFFTRLFKLLLNINNKLSKAVELLALIESQQRGENLQNLQVEWMDNQDVMQKLHISASTLKRRRQDGTIRSTRIKGKYYYKESDISRALDPYSPD